MSRFIRQYVGASVRYLGLLNTLVSAATIALPQLAHGATITLNKFAFTAITDQVPQPVTLPQFDSALGTLRSTDIQVRGEFDFSIRFAAIDNPSAVVTPIPVVNITGIVQNAPPIPVSFAALGPSSLPVVGSASGPFSYSFTSADVTATPDSLASRFGFFDVENYAAGPSGNYIGTNQTVQSGGSRLIATVTYTYDPVPEPASFAVLSVGLLATAIGFSGGSRRFGSSLG